MYSSQTGQVTRAPSGSKGVVATFVGGVKAHPKLSTVLITWALMGLLFVFAPAPVKVTPEMQEKFDSILAKVPQQEIAEAMIALEQQEILMSEVRVWFWRWRPEYREQVEARQPALDAAQARVDELLYERSELLKDAREAVGIWSEYGVEEARGRFWNSMYGGKEMAKRMTMWDAVFVGFSAMGRDDSIVTVLIQILIRFLFNITIGLIMALISFFFTVISLLFEFRVGILSGLLFAAAAIIGASSVVVGTLTALFGGIGGAVFLSVKAAGGARLQDGGRRQRIHYD